LLAIELDDACVLIAMKITKNLELQRLQAELRESDSKKGKNMSGMGILDDNKPTFAF
jgi:hypothetical protein